jgi:hypothetical protein
LAGDGNRRTGSVTTEPIEPKPTDLASDNDKLPATDSANPSRQPPDGVTIYGIAAIATFCSLIAITVALLGYHHYFDKDTRIAVVNLDEVMEAKQLQLAAMVKKSGMTEKDQLAAYDAAAGFGKDLQEAIERVQEECDCLLLISNAVVSQNRLNLTGRIKELAGLGDLDIAALKKSLEQQMRFSPEIGVMKQNPQEKP